jgi:hypothetical protein
MGCLKPFALLIMALKTYITFFSSQQMSMARGVREVAIPAALFQRLVPVTALKQSALMAGKA